MTVTELISILQQQHDPAAVVVLAVRNSENVVSLRNHDIERVALLKVLGEYRDTYETVAQADEHDAQGVLLG
jgi:hypothetical protein